MDSPGSDFDLSHIALAILAGGEGRRMGFPKGEMHLRGRPILQSLLERFDWPGPTLLISAPGREHPPGWEAFAKEVADPVAGQGPLRGVLTALEAAPSPAVLVTAVDMPLLGREQLVWLAQNLNDRPDAAGVMLRQGRQVQPFPSAFRVDAAAVVVRRMWAVGRRSVQSLSDDPAIVLVDAPSEWDARTWTNLNSPGDLDALP